MYWCAHKTATLTSIQHTVGGHLSLPPLPSPGSGILVDDHENFIVDRHYKTQYNGTNLKPI